MHRRVDSIERCVNILTRARIAEMQGLTIEPQRQIGMPLKVARVPPLASKVVGTRYSGGDDLICNHGPTRTKRSRRRRKDPPVS